MKKFFILLFVLALLPRVYGVDTELQDMTELTTPTGTDIFYILDDPAGTPLSRKITWDNIMGSITKIGTIATGTWNATDIGVEYGGTGVSTLTDGGVLLGSGIGTITVLDVLLDGYIIVGDGVTDPVALAAFTSSTGDLKHEAGGLEADISAYGGLVGITGGATLDVDTSAEIIAAIGDETGTGALVFATSPTLVTPVLGTIASGVGTALTALAGGNIQDNTIKEASVDWGSGTDQIDLADIPGGTAPASAFDFGGATSLEVPNAESTDATLTALGQICIRGDEDRISYHVGAGGEVAGEVTKSVLSMIAFSIDPGAWYDIDAEIFLFEVRADVFPNGIIIDEWECSCNINNPSPEINADLRWADAWIGFGNAADIDEIDTTSGISSEDTDVNINGGAAVAAGKVIYIGFDGDPEGTCVQMHFEMLFHAEED